CIVERRRGVRMKLLVTGATGQVGWELARSLMPLGEVVALDRAERDQTVRNGDERATERYPLSGGCRWHGR
ncbi:MAG: sugar nucleotide-binding protein, partial [Myxococcales bacterium]|nr:sugar nucleotide-binding protein [Myxococcales bacterium]